MAALAFRTFARPSVAAPVLGVPQMVRPISVNPSVAFTTPVVSSPVVGAHITTRMWSRGLSTLASLRLGDTAPNFVQQSTKGNIDFHDWIGDSWAVLFSHPADYTPVCTTELGMVQKLLPQFKQRNVKVIALSTDDVESHQGWIKDIEETQQVDSVDYPILADPDHKVSEAYGMLDQTQRNLQGLPATVRSVFIIDPKKTIRTTLTYPASTGRNFDEIIRVIDSLQLTDTKKLATPANWTPGDECVIVPAVDNATAKELFPQGWNEKRPYLRMVKP